MVGRLPEWSLAAAYRASGPGVGRIIKVRKACVGIAEAGADDVKRWRSMCRNKEQSGVARSIAKQPGSQ